MEAIAPKTKVELRHQMRERLAALTMDEVHAASASAERRLERLPVFAHAHSVLAYVSRRHELDTHPIIQRLLQHGRRVYVPHFDEATRQYAVSELRDFHGELAVGKYEILEPRPEAVRRAHPNIVDVFLVPGLAFDRTGNRLGRGKGYFDRLLHEVRGVKIGLAHDFQLLDEVPADAHDVHMNLIVTETRIVHCKRTDQ